MRSVLPGQALGQVIVLTIGLGVSGMGFAQPKAKSRSSEAGGDKTIEKQSAWEQQVMGEDNAKKSDLRKIAAAQKLADQARKNPPPIAAPKVKDPSKEGVRAKQEASIGLPIASDEAPRSPRGKNGKNGAVAADGSAGSGRSSGKKGAQPVSSANDELGSLVATSLAEDRASQAAAGTHAGVAGDGPLGRSAVNDGRTNRPRGGSRAHARGKLRMKSAGEGVAGRGSPGALDELFAAGK